jgi:hypothetical protein
MTGGDQILHDGRADPSGGSGDKYTHEGLLGFVGDTLCLLIILVKK